MKIGFLASPTLFQRTGGLQNQVRSTLNALLEEGVDARLANPYEESLGVYDILHVFSAINGTFRFVQYGREIGVPAVVSAVVQIEFSPSLVRRKKLAERLTQRITRYEARTSFGESRTALTLADRVIALGRSEADTLSDAYDVDPARIGIIPNGVDARFFDATPDFFVQQTGLQPGFAFVPGNVSDYKGQLRLIEALAEDDVPIVLAGNCTGENQAYLERCLELGGTRTRYLGALTPDDPLLASAYAAAGVTVLPSVGEVAPNVITESLAAGTPAVVTRLNALDLDEGTGRFSQIEPGNRRAIRSAVLEMLRAPAPPEACAAAVANRRWDAIARRINAIYRDLV